MATTRIASANIKRGLGWGPLQRATQRLLDRNVGIIGFQEIYDGRIKKLRRMLAKKGYGLAASQDVPIAYDVKRYKLITGNARRLPGQASKDNSNPARYGNWVALKDRKTGEVKVVTNTHLSRRRTAREQQMHDRQIKELADLQRDLRKRFGKKADYFMTGDMNNANREALSRFGLRGSRMKGAPIDWIFAEGRPDRKRLMNTASDHDTYIATFREKTRKGKNGGGGGGNGGGGGGGNDMSTAQDWAEYWAGGGASAGLEPPGSGEGPDRDGLDAFELLTELLESWGVPVGRDIRQIIRNAMKDGITPDQIDLILPDIYETKSFNDRFTGWKEREKNGFNAMTVGEYLQMEDAYRAVLEQSGLPAGFYDDYSDLGRFIAMDIGVEELQSRIDIAVDATRQVDPTMRKVLARYYGVGRGDIAAYFLDPQRAQTLIEHQYQTAGVASWAMRAGLDVSDRRRYEQLVHDGITMEQAAQSYGAIGQLSETVGRIAGIYGESYSQTDAEDDIFFNRSEKRQRIMKQESATFGGATSGMTGSADRPSY